MNHCGKCGAGLRRVPRTALQRIRYAAVFECAGCGAQEYVVRRYRLHFGPNARCPLCGTADVKKRQRRDRIDPMHWSFLTLLELVLSGGKLFHCEFCRVQFYDRRSLAPDTRKVN